MNDFVHKAYPSTKRQETTKCLRNILNNSWKILYLNKAYRSRKQLNLNACLVVHHSVFHIIFFSTLWPPNTYIQRLINGFHLITLLYYTNYFNLSKWLLWWKSFLLIRKNIVFLRMYFITYIHSCICLFC